ncbi:MAG: PKD domain-containing protein, partial [Candidatus Peregrinibacteria bacterium]|nr:PKD domain-containing protein [Candidatus Peregrinibacteria bacterium]
MRAKNFSKIKKNLKNLAAIAALSTLLIGVFAIPGAMALDIELNTDGVEEAICDAIDGPNDSGLFQCSDESGSSFTDFEGEFDAPDEEGYAEGITTTSSAREFVVNVTNFVLQFLGLSAIVVIIYGGFMYVTSAGEQERAEKGKKSVMYAVIGILVVLISYALVNTIIQGAAGGEDATSSDGLYSSSGVSSDSLSEFQAAEMAESLEDLTQAYIEEYTIFTNVSAIMDAMANVPHFGADGLAELEEGFELILDEVDSFSDTADYAKEALQEIRRYISLNFTDRVLQFVDVKEWGQASVLQMSVLLAEESSIEEEADACIDDCKDDYGAFNSSRYSCIAACTNEADATEENDPYEVAGEMIEYMSLTSSMSATEFAYAMIDIQNDLEDMQTSFENIETIRALFDEAIEGFDTYISSSYDATTYSYDYIASGGYTSASIYEGPPGGASHLGDVIEMLNEIHGLIKELEFTTAIISANTDKGNAPLVVSFNALDSYDPTDLTIPDENYVWDLYGNGFDTNVSDVNGNPDNTTGANVSYTYSEPGTYRVALRVDSNDPENIASGISYLSVKVSPPSSVIRLTATPEGDTSLAITLKDADQDINETSWTITGETAEQGITFDASGTTDANGDNTIVEYDFDFGDGESQTGEDDTAIHYYTEEGTFEFELEVTDQNGNKDRAIVNITVASPAASIKASQTNVEIGDTVYFDGSGSLTDNGNITNYHWIIEDDDYEDENGDEDLYYTFDSPGSYTVTLEVTDSSGLSNEASVIVTVNSTEPVATFSWDIPDSKAPYRVNFDGTKSYDDDDEDILSYEWLIAGTEGIDYDYAESTSATSAKPIVYFYSVGNWDVTLTVRDQYLDELQQENSYKKTITVTSVLGIAVEDSNGSSIAFLEPTYDADGNVGGAVATISLDLESNYGVSYKIDWADVSSVETVPVSSVGSTQSVTHNYDTAGTYPVNITVYSSDGDTNSMTHNVFIGNGEEPIPVITVTMNDLSPADENNITGDRTTSFKFDATKSVDLDGSALASGSYSWN